MKYRKKPIIVEAIKYDLPLNEMIEALLNFGMAVVANNGNSIVICTFEGAMHAAPGDYIVKGIAGEFYPVKNDIFLATYERVEE